MSDSPRYNIDPSDLSLMISNVQRNDSFENYRCEVGVEDPRSPSRTTYSYELTRNHSIVLKVVGEYAYFCTGLKLIHPKGVGGGKDQMEGGRGRELKVWYVWGGGGSSYSDKNVHVIYKTHPIMPVLIIIKS